MLAKSLLILTFGIAVISESAAFGQPLGGPPRPGLGGPPRPGLGGPPRPGPGGPPRFAGPRPGPRFAGPRAARPGPRARLAGPARFKGGDRGVRGNLRGGRGYRAAYGYGGASRYGYARGRWRRGYGVYASGSDSSGSSGCYYSSRYSKRRKAYTRVLVCSGGRYGRG
jgi:hypothetical protein